MHRPHLLPTPPQKYASEHVVLIHSVIGRKGFQASRDVVKIANLTALILGSHTFIKFKRCWAYTCGVHMETNMVCSTHSLVPISMPYSLPYLEWYMCCLQSYPILSTCATSCSACMWEEVTRRVEHEVCGESRMWGSQVCNVNSYCEGMSCNGIHC